MLKYLRTGAVALALAATSCLVAPTQAGAATDPVTDPGTEPVVAAHFGGAVAEVSAPLYLGTSQSTAILPSGTLTFSEFPDAGTVRTMSLTGDVMVGGTAVARLTPRLRFESRLGSLPYDDGTYRAFGYTSTTSRSFLSRLVAGRTYRIAWSGGRVAWTDVDGVEHTDPFEVADSTFGVIAQPKNPWVTVTKRPAGRWAFNALVREYVGTTRTAQVRWAARGTRVDLEEVVPGDDPVVTRRWALTVGSSGRLSTATLTPRKNRMYVLEIPESSRLAPASSNNGIKSGTRLRPWSVTYAGPN